jgi:hypothetical protein
MIRSFRLAPIRVIIADRWQKKIDTVLARAEGDFLCVPIPLVCRTSSTFVHPGFSDHSRLGNPKIPSRPTKPLHHTSPRLWLCNLLVCPMKCLHLRVRLRNRVILQSLRSGNNRWWFAWRVSDSWNSASAFFSNGNPSWLWLICASFLESIIVIGNCYHKKQRKTLARFSSWISGSKYCWLIST